MCLVFDKVINFPSGFVSGIQMIPQFGTNTDIIMVEGQNVEIHNLYCLLVFASKCNDKSNMKWWGRGYEKKNFKM